MIGRLSKRQEVFLGDVLVIIMLDACVIAQGR